MEKLTPEERVILTPEWQKEFLRKIPGYTAMKNARDAKGALERFDDKITQKLWFNPKELVDEALKNGKIIPPKK